MRPVCKAKLGVGTPPAPCNVRGTVGKLLGCCSPTPPDIATGGVKPPKATLLWVPDVLTAVATLLTVDPGAGIPDAIATAGGPPPTPLRVGAVVAGVPDATTPVVSMFVVVVTEGDFSKEASLSFFSEVIGGET